MTSPVHKTTPLNRTFSLRILQSSSTGKELDRETGYGYHGARYMDYELMTGWLSVDPMADKYPNISPYNYCMWNPIKILDPDGMDTIISINTKGPSIQKIIARSDIGKYKKQYNKYVSNKNLSSYARNNYKEPSEFIHVFMHGDQMCVELADGEILYSETLYQYIFSKSPQLQKNEINNQVSLVVLHSCCTGKGEMPVAKQLSQESSSLIVVAPTDMLSAQNGGETVDNNGKWNVYKEGKLVKQYDGLYRTPKQMEELCKKIKNEFK